MFFYLSKLLWFVIDPGNLLLMALVGGTALLWTRWRVWGRRLLALAALAALFFALVPVGAAMRLELEERFPIPATLPERIDGIVVLGGILNQFITRARGQPALGGAVERLTEAAGLARRYPKARLLFTGGAGTLTRQTVKEAHFVAPFLAQLGVDPGRITFEDKARNTAENARLSKLLANPGADENWLLVTSAMHMPRAVGAFRQAGWRVIPYPVDFTTDGEPDWAPPFHLLEGLNAFASAFREWLGLIFYRLTGRTGTLFPAP